MRQERIITSLTKKPYVWITIITFFVYLLVNMFINQTFTAAGVLITYKKTFLIPFIFFNLLVAILIAMCVSLIYMRVKELQKIKTVSGVTVIGILAGMITGACPGCFVGILPFIVGLFGGTFNLARLPWHGIELQIASSVLLLIAIYYLSKDNTCKIK